MAPDATPFLSGRKVVVCGAGLAGLTFVLSLLQTWDAAVPAPEVLLVDADGRDESLARGRYDLQLNADTEDSALVGLRDLGLLDDVLAQAVTRNNPDATMHVWDKAWKSLVTIKPKLVEGFATGGVRIPRSALLALLVAAVEARTKISWGTAVQDATRLPDGTLRVSLLDKTAGGAASQVLCDLLVAADGDESTLRRIFRPDDVTKLTGHVAMGGQVDFGDRASAPAPLTRDFGIVVGGDGVASALVQLNNNGKLLWSVFKEEKTPRAAYDNTDAAAFAALLDEARATSKSIAEPLPSLIRQTRQDTSFARPVRERDAFAHDAPALRGVIFLGDANRHVSVYMNNGGALAIRDGIGLAQELKAHASLEAATAAYDKAALARSTKAIKAGRQTMTTAHLSGWKWSVAKTALSAGSLLTGN
ncbi:monooxygenase, putative [Cordyceps militaris]|uniref:Monooxygenase, putative n=1 Tax=Cordyceps militaris TaxID=73501 RepID=A0A2H4SMS8_CORMI|nr:monooxygenase, putative [Cordyceps militaris]